MRADLEMVCKIDPMCDDHAYFLGLLATDGTISETTRNRGRISFELSAVDASILRSLACRIPYTAHLSRRRRKTNFRDTHESVVLRFHSLELRRQLDDFGYRAGRKSATVRPPDCRFDERGFWRGVIDGDGSLGTTALKKPFISLVTASQPLRDAYIAFVARITGSRPNPARNARDGVYNIVLYSEPAQELVGELYRDDVIAIPRKLMAAQSVLEWRRPLGCRRRTFDWRRWTEDEDRLVVADIPLRVLATRLGRTETSVNLRRWRLRNGVAGERSNRRSAI